MACVSSLTISRNHLSHGPNWYWCPTCWMWIPYGPVHQSAHDTNHGASGTRPCHACGQILRPNAPAASRASTAVPQRNKLTPNEIHAKEEEHAKETIGLAKDIKHGMSAASVRKKYNVSDSDIISRLATVTKQLHEILDVKGLVSPDCCLPWLLRY